MTPADLSGLRMLRGEDPHTEWKAAPGTLPRSGGLR